MTEELKKTIKEEMAELPKEGQEAINAVPWLKIAEEMATKYELSEDELENLQIETLLLLIGSTDPEFYAINIENHVEIPKDEAEQIAKEGFDKIFIPIKKILDENIKKNLQNKNTTTEENLNFILSGGDYSVFLEKVPEKPETSTIKINKTPSIPVTPPTLAETQASVRKTNKPPLMLPSKPKIEDIKSKFVI